MLVWRRAGVSAAADGGRLERAGALVQVKNDRYYLHGAAYAGFCRRRRLASGMVAAVVLTMTAVFFWGDV